MNELEKCPSSMGEEAWGPGLRRDWISASLACEQGILAQLLAAACVVIALRVCLFAAQVPNFWSRGFLGNILCTPVIPGFVLSSFPFFFFQINSTIMVQFIYHNVHPIVRILFWFFFFFG